MLPVRWHEWALDGQKETTGIKQPPSGGGPSRHGWPGGHSEGPRQNIRLATKVDLHTIAARTPGMVGADLANIINEAALLAARREAGAVETKDLEEAIDRVTLGLEKRTRVMTPAETERVAYHETGHALTALSVQYADPV